MSQGESVADRVMLALFAALCWQSTLAQVVTEDQIAKVAEWEKEIYGDMTFPDGWADKRKLLIPKLSIDRDTEMATLEVPYGQEDHSITAAWVRDSHQGNIVFFKEFSSTDELKAEFKIPVGTEQLKPYEHCDVHGTWAGSSVYAPIINPKDEL